MKRILGLLVIAVFPGQVTSVAQEAGALLETTNDRAGRVVEKLAWPETVKEYVTVYYPSDFDPTKIYSVHFWFHGTSGSPQAGISTAHDGYIGIGMSYLKADHIPPGESGSAHWKLCQSIRKSIEQRHQLRLNRNVVSGVSKGGWLAFYIGAEPRPNLHAIGIIAAGRDPNVREIPDLSQTGLAVLVATGETDPNFPQAQLAVDFFKKAGAASVCYEEWLGKGHISTASPRVVQWLEVESRRGQPQVLLEQWASKSLAKDFETVSLLPNPLDRYIGLRHLMGDPRLPHSGPEWSQKIRTSGRQMSQDPAVLKWLEAFAKVQGLVRKEAAFFDSRNFNVPQLTELVARYREMVEIEEYPDLSARAANSYMRAAKMKTIYEAQIKAKENPEYQNLTQRYAELQRIFSDANGSPGAAVMDELKTVGGRISELRFEASMGAFREVEWRGEVDIDGSVNAVIDADKKDPNPWKAYSGTAF